jgi:hypothetical protein
MKEKTQFQELINQIDEILANGRINATEFRKFEILILKSLRAIMDTLRKILEKSDEEKLI